MTKPGKWLIALLLTLSALFGNAQTGVLYYSAPPPGFANQKIPKDSVEEDLRFWMKIIAESHVNPYHAISKEDLTALRSGIIDRLPDSVSHSEASFAISEMIGALGEGHLGFATSAVSDSIYQADCIRFPYLINAFTDDGLIVQRDLSSEGRLPANSTITAINGKPVRYYFDRFKKLFGGLPAWKELMVASNIRKLLFMDGVLSPFTIDAIVNGQPGSFRVNGYTRAQADSLNRVLSAGAAQPAPFSLRFMENNIAFLEFNSMNRSLRDSFNHFLQRAFTDIRQKKAAGLIIDLRQNGGGDSGLGDMLISYFSDKPYRNTSGMKMRISEHSKNYARLVGAHDPFEKWENGKLYEYEVKNLTKPGPNKLRFTGKVAVLIGKGTFSSANMLTNAISDYKLATLVGENTAEPGNDFGEMVPFMLPHTHIVTRVAIKMFKRANGDENDYSGIRADIEVKNSPDDVLQKMDRVAERAVEWIRKG